ncbi:lipopolysaccharide-modifying protein [Artemisia annua]|uniref:Lipopolysaccharide-modifying protein n=1 Tax=Artemisia annua TaxID=35608 RepID=A0A2U1LW02_ARTAN|nr:lipopolysaccharide-modifying protein [Artemisia annua]
MKYKPTVPENATELCSETMACTSEGFVKQLMDQSTINVPANVSPYIMQPPYDPHTHNSILGQKANSAFKCCSLVQVAWFGDTVFGGEVGAGDGVTSAMVAKQRRQWWRCDVGDSGVAKTSMVDIRRQG